MKCLLDTNILIKVLHKKEPFNKNLRSKAVEDLFINGITVGEINYGIEKSGPTHKAKNRIARDALMSQFQHLYMDKEVSEEYGKIKAELFGSGSYGPDNENDIWIAAHARAKSYTLITENIKDFQSIPGLTIESWATDPVTSITT